MSDNLESNLGLMSETDTSVLRYQALLDMAGLLAHHTVLSELFHQLGKRLRQVVSFDMINFALHDEAHMMMRLNIWEGPNAPPLAINLALQECVAGWVWEQQQPLFFGDLSQEDRYPKLFDQLRERGMQSYCVLPLSTAQQRLGALGFASSKLASYGERELEFLQRITELVALAVEGALTRQGLTAETDRLQTLLAINRTLATSSELPGIFPAIADKLRRLMRVEYASVAVPNDGLGGMRIWLADSALAGTEAGIVIPTGDSLCEHAYLDREVKVFGRPDLEAARSEVAKSLFAQGIQSLCSIPLVTTKGALGVLNLGSTTEAAFEHNLDLLAEVASQVAIALENARAYQEIAELKDKLAEEKLYLEDEIRKELNFEEIIGESLVLKEALNQAKTVAGSAATVLVLGDTGTGKELLARAIHNMSERRDNTFIKLNCAAIPTGLLESELFGHEKGAFTGAISQKVGRMELADKGTLFLDEVGDIPPELQPKLLRVLQDQEFERLGSTRTIKVDVRLIAATNRDLGKLVAAREFRSDLYYRLNVFPIRMPALRERRKDIPLMVRYFVQRLSRRMNKQIDAIPADTMNILMAWDWPGNVRELENFIERSVILSTGPTLRVPVTELKPLYDGSTRKDVTLETAEREHILRVLREAGGVISGPKGAATRLGVKRTTLQSKMQKLGISRQDYGN